MWDYVICEVGGGGGAEERWDVPLERGKDEQEKEKDKKKKKH